MAARTAGSESAWIFSGLGGNPHANFSNLQAAPEDIIRVAMAPDDAASRKQARIQYTTERAEMCTALHLPHSTRTVYLCTGQEE